MNPRVLLLAALLLPASVACRSAYYGALEKFGIEKREILADRVEEGREAQTEAKEQFQSALAAFQALTGFEGGKLEDAYQSLDDEYEDSRERAEEVEERIAAIERVATDLFAEWEEEIGTMQEGRLRGESERLLGDTRTRYGKLASAMQRAAAAMEPVLAELRDHVLFLKHNLNARAVAALEGELVTIEGDVGALVSAMEAAIAEADAFLAAMETDG